MYPDPHKDPHGIGDFCDLFILNHRVLEENIGKTLSDRNHSRILYDPPPRILEIKAKINKWDLFKLMTSAQQRKL